MQLTDPERAVLEFLAERGGQVRLDELRRQTEVQIPSDRRLTPAERGRGYILAFKQLLDKGLVGLGPEEAEVRLTPRGLAAVTGSFLLLQYLLQTLSTAGPLPRTALTYDSADPEGLDLAIAYALRRKWVDQKAEGQLILTRRGTSLLGKPDEKNELHALQQQLLWLQAHAREGIIRLGESTDSSAFRHQYLSYLEDLGLIRQTRTQPVMLTTEGRAALSPKAEQAALNPKHSVLTVEDLRSGAYLRDDFHLTPIDPSKPPAPTFPGKEALATVVLRTVRHSFAQLGFEEFQTTPVEMAFWNYDLLLFPPDHPKRDEERVYYLDEMLPARPPRELYERWRDLWTREPDQSGFDFEYPNPERSMRRLLRTHLTPATIGHLAALTDKGHKGGGRHFALGRVYSPTQGDAIMLHAEGLMVGAEATMRTLVETIVELLTRVRKSRGSDLALRGTCYPYTAPSVMMVDRQLNRCLASGGMIRPELLVLLNVDRERCQVGAFALFFQLNDIDGSLLFGRLMSSE